MTKGCGCYFGLFKTPEGVKPRLTVVFAGMSFPESVRKLMDVARLEAQIMRRKMEKDLAKAEMSTVEEFCFFENGGESIKKAGDTDVKNILAVEEAEKLELEEVDLVTMAREGTSPETGVDTMAVKEMEAEKPKDEFEETLKAIKPYKAIWRYLLAGIFMMILVAGFLVFKVGVFEEQMLEPLEATLNLEEGKILTPAGFISLTPQSDMFFLLVDKTRGKLNLYNSSSQLVKSYSNVLGYEEGNVIQGVNPELPEGIYFAVAKLEGKDLPANFFPLAYRLNYPNPLDSVVEYEAGSLILGGYIGTTKEGFESGLNLGLSETDMKEINYFISLNKTPIMIYNLCEMIPQSAKANKSAEIKGFLSKWQNAWNIKDLGIFRKCYAPEFLPDSGERKNWLEEESFQLGESEKITLENLQILDAGTWVLAMFEQNYQDEYGRGWGIRRLYLGKNVEGEWEIKGEEFLKF
jgi:murein L,D-transpeptidase YafK